MFFVFEGPEGVGKTTQIELLYQRLLERGVRCIKTREPGGTPFSEKIRDLFKMSDESIEPPLPMTELFLICAARVQHVQKVIKPALRKNIVILCDRFLDSTYVYQHIIGGADKADIDLVHNLLAPSLMPTLTFFLHCGPSVSIERLSGIKFQQKDRLDNLPIEFHQKISNAYLQILRDNFSYPSGEKPVRLPINANQSPEEIALQIEKSIFGIL